MPSRRRLLIARQSEEYRNGDTRDGSFFYDHTEQDTCFLLLQSVWVHPRLRAAGIAGGLCQQLATASLETCAELAQPWAGCWFWRRTHPRYTALLQITRDALPFDGD